MKFEDAIQNLTLKFTSSNDIPIERATILRKEWKPIEAEIDRLRKYEKSSIFEKIWNLLIGK